MTDMEIYRNTEAQVTIPSPTVLGGTHVIEVASTNGATSTPTFTSNAANGTVTFLVDFKHTLYDGRLRVTDTITRPAPTPEDAAATESFVVTDYLDVVTPLFLKSDLPADYQTGDQWKELENLVRMVVEAFTGQHFGRRIETHTVNTNGVNFFQVPIIEYTGLSARYMTNTTTLNPPKFSYEFIDGNFGMKITSSPYYDIKTDSMWVLGQRVPAGYVCIDGVFGYDRVPSDVKAAALLIAGLWGCKQTLWRDRFIQTMRSSDWSLQYHDGAFGPSTGSVTADNLLAKYSRRYSPEVI